jgi:hypothetical protein
MKTGFRLKASGFGLCVVAMAAAVIGAPSEARAGVANYNALPTGHLPKQPASTTKPASIPAHEKVQGMFVTLPPKDQRERKAANGFVQVHVFTTEQRAKDFAAGKFTGDDVTGVCMTSSIFGFGGIEPNVESDWPSMAISELTITSERRTVTAVHQERLSTDGSGKASLEYVDAWVDPDTLGARQIARGSLPLVRVASGPSGIEVYAARDEGLVHFVVRPGSVPDEMKTDANASFVQSLARRLIAQMPGALASGNSECGHLRVSLEASAHDAQMATVQATALFPPLEKPKDDEDDASGAKTDGPMTNASMRALRAFRSLRKRQLLVNLSASQTASDDRPLLSVSFGWAGKEDEQQF